MTEDEQTCLSVLRAGSKTFFAASLLLPPRMRGPVAATYAFCRTSDDEIDAPKASSSRRRVASLQQRVDRLYSPHASLSSPVDRAFCRVVQVHSIPRDVLDLMLEGFAQDETGTEYKTLSDVISYSVRVASTVGIMMSKIMNVHDRAALERAADLGIAMQLTNIARDVGEDAVIGRMYLPTDWLHELGSSRQESLDECSRGFASPAIRQAVKRLLVTAEDFYSSAIDGIGFLPLDCQPAIHAARRLYAAIGDVIASHDYDSVSVRAVTSPRRKLFELSRALIDMRAPVRVRSTFAREAGVLLDAC